MSVRKHLFLQKALLPCGDTTCGLCDKKCVVYTQKKSQVTVSVELFITHNYKGGINTGNIVWIHVVNKENHD